MEITSLVDCGVQKSSCVKVDCDFVIAGSGVFLLIDRLRFGNLCCCFAGGKTVYLVPFEDVLGGMLAYGVKVEF